MARHATLRALTRGTLRMCGSAMRAPFNRSARISFLEAARVYHGVYLREPRLPRIPPEEIVAGSNPIQLTRYVRGKWELALQELAILIGLVRERDARHIFEIGTFDGRTTLNVRLNAPEAVIHTIDLPGGNELAPDGKRPGSLIRDLVERGDIHQLWGDSTRFDFSPWFGSQDLVFVDAGHGYGNAAADSLTALRLVEGREGVILWHDYGSWPGVTQAVDEVREAVASPVSMGWIDGTALAVLVARPGEPIRLKPGRATHAANGTA